MMCWPGVWHCAGNNSKHASHSFCSHAYFDLMIEMWPVCQVDVAEADDVCILFWFNYFVTCFFQNILLVTPSPVSQTKQASLHFLGVLYICHLSDLNKTTTNINKTWNVCIIIIFYILRSISWFCHLWSLIYIWRTWIMKRVEWSL